MWILEILKAILLGIVEGITEWLPVSSTGHMILLDELVKLAAEKLKELPPLTVYEPEYTEEDSVVVTENDIMETIVRRENEKFIVEGQWLFNFMGNINFSDYESLNFFQRVLQKNGVIAKLRDAGVEEGDTVSIYDFEFEFMY